MWTSDPERDAARHDADVYAWESQFPVCELCGEHIVGGEEYVKIKSKWYHRDCIEEGMMSEEEIA